MQTNRLLSFSSNSPSFNAFSSAVDLTAIAARVIEEFKDQDPEYDFHRDEDDFEFSFDCLSHKCSQPLATADEIFSNGRIRPLITYKEETQSTSSTVPRRHRPALRELMSEERDTAFNSSSEGEEDLIGVAPESYCVWTPKESKIKIKSNSAGFSKRWKLRNLIYARSASEGNNKIVFPVPEYGNRDEKISVQREEPPSKENGNRHEEEKEREEAKRQSYVSYREDMM